MTVTYSRKIRESPLFIGKNEVIPYTLTFSGFDPAAVTTLTSPTCTLFDITSGEPGTDVSGTKLTGTASFSGVIMTLKLISGLADGSRYLLRCQGQGGGGTYELWAEVIGER